MVLFSPAEWRWLHFPTSARWMLEHQAEIWHRAPESENEQKDARVAWTAINTTSTIITTTGTSATMTTSPASSHHEASSPYLAYMRFLHTLSHQILTAQAYEVGAFFRWENETEKPSSWFAQGWTVSTREMRREGYRHACCRIQLSECMRHSLASVRSVDH